MNHKQLPVDEIEKLEDEDEQKRAEQTYKIKDRRKNKPQPNKKRVVANLKVKPL